MSTEIETLRKIEENYPLINGHQVTPIEWKTFEKFCETGRVKETSDAVNVSPATIYRWRQTSWWKQLLDDIVVPNQNLFYSKLAKAAPEIFDIYMDILRGTYKQPKMANAAMKGVEFFMRMGKGGIEPILNSRPFIEVHKNTINIANFNSEKMSEIWQKMDEKERTDFHMKGIIPDKFRAELDADNQEADEDVIDIIPESVESIEGEENEEEDIRFE